MADKSHVWQSSPLTVVPKVANRPDRTAARRYLKDGRACLVLVATAAVATNAWALFRLPDESGPDVPRVTASPPSAADVNSARQGVAGNPLELSRANAFRLMDAELVSSAPTMDGPAAWYPSPVANVSQVSVRSKLQALLMMLSSQSGVVDPGSGGEAAGVAGVAGFGTGTVDGTPRSGGLEQDAGRRVPGNI
jgi:hypothetical protein